MTNELDILGLISNWWLFVPWTTLWCSFVHFIESQVQIWKS